MPSHVLELCCGWKSVSNCLVQDHGWTATTVDILPKFKPTLLVDVTTWDYRAYYACHPPPDVIWASPPCRSFTVAAWSKHRDGAGGATSADGEKGDACVRACLAVIEHCRALNPTLVFFVENPLYGAFRKLDCVRPFIERGECRHLQYGDYAPATHSLKPTLVLTNCVAWLPKPMVLRKSVVHWDHLSKKRRTVIPRAVCAEIAHVCCQIVSEEFVEGQP
jgi:hypothetical protein